MKNTIKLLSLLAAGAMISAGFAQAQDKALLDALVNKGVLTQQEAEQIAKETVVVKPAQSTTRSIAINGMVQAQYRWIQNDVKTNPIALGTGKQRAVNDFTLRRLYLGATADLGNGWSGVINADFAATTTGAGGRNYIDKAFIRKAVDWDFLQGNLDVGYRKVNFGQEENTGAASLLAIERSIATNYFTGGPIGNLNDVNVGARYVGIFWDGTVPQVDGLSYSLAITNTQNQTFQVNNAVSNSIATWVGVAYTNNFDELGYSGGLNFGYLPKANVGAGLERSIYVFNPYVELTYDAALLRAEYLMGRVENGQAPQALPGTGSQSATPMGINATVAYTFDLDQMGAIQPVFRYSWLQTNGRGVQPSDVIPGANAVGTNPNFNYANAFYFGANWYLMGESVKVSAGYEYTQFNQTAVAPGVGNRANTNAIRAQLQLLF